MTDEMPAPASASARALREALEAARALAKHVERSVNVGPLSKSPAKEARLWRELRAAITNADAALASAAPEQAGELATLTAKKDAAERSAANGWAKADAYKRERDEARAEQAGEFARLHDALTKINAIRNSIIGTQTVNWSAHVYPLVAALEEAGYPGQGYDVARKEAETLLEELNRLRALAREPETQGWRDISTAPRDGTTIQVYRYVAPWHVVGYARWVDVAGVAGWVSYGYSDTPGNLGLGSPTLWQPLPAPPASAARAKEET